MRSPSARLLVAIAAAASLAAAPAADDRLKDVQKKIEDAEHAARSIADQTQGALGEIDTLDRSIATHERRLKTMADGMRTAEKRRDEAERRRKALDAALPELMAKLSTRARGLHRLSHRGLGPVVFQSPRDWSDSTRYRRSLEAIVTRDHELLREVKKNRADAEQARKDAAAHAAALAAQRIEAEKELAAQKGERDTKQTMLASLREQGDKQSKLLEELKASAERLHDLIEREEEAAKEKPFEPPPATGGAHMRPPLRGDAGNVVAARNGVEIRVAEGTPVLAVKAGQVVFAGWFAGYGQMVILDHGDRLYSIYGYASELSVERGGAVDVGQPIAKVGATGPVSAPSLYFEIRDHGSPRDPVAYIPSLARK